MLNHIRTLLINEPAADQAAVSPTHVPSQFLPLPVPLALRGISQTLLPSALSDKVAVVDDICVLAHAGELEPYMTRFDARVTYAQTATAGFADLLRNIPARVQLTELLQRISRMPVLETVGRTAFTWPAYAQDMDDLFRIWTGPTEGVLRVGALALAYAYQLERVRRGGG